MDEDNIIDVNGIVREQFNEHWAVATQKYETGLEFIKQRISNNENNINVLFKEVARVEKTTATAISELRADFNKEIKTQCDKIIDHVNTKIDDQSTKLDSQDRKLDAQGSKIDDLSTNINLLINNLGLRR